MSITVLVSHHRGNNLAGGIDQRCLGIGQGLRGGQGSHGNIDAAVLLIGGKTDIGNHHRLGHHQGAVLVIKLGKTFSGIVAGHHIL